MPGLVFHLVDDSLADVFSGTESAWSCLWVHMFAMVCVFVWESDTMFDSQVFGPFAKFVFYLQNCPCYSSNNSTLFGE